MSVSNTTKNILNEFTTYGLVDSKQVNLMNRIDTKYLFHIDKLNVFLQNISEYYSVLEVNKKRILRYNSLYYDTKGLLFYHLHHSGHMNRHKVRARYYLDSGDCYLEVKFKNNKGRTIKNRCVIDSTKSIKSDECRGFLSGLDVPEVDKLVPVQESSYSRISLAYKNNMERVTIDVDLQNKLLGQQSNTVYSQPNVVIVEVKQVNSNRHTPAMAAIRQLGIRKSRYSKYCMGLVNTMSDSDCIKKNRFKSIETRINSILTDCR